ncbi:hypothetical protein PG997_002818 [Apiospora hydei]|uniref:Uncharacterized protein n=1 Tax=Apiospora hydei TaxID=1337664 RepID=A0ABR1WXP2_9PEZI
MPASDDHVLAALFAGFSIGFGWFTAWAAIQQTRRIKNPLRSAYIYMVWGELVANVPIGVLGWLLLDGVLAPTLPVLFMVLFFWVFETQLQPQIIINRIGIIAESQKTVAWARWCTVAFVGLINISVFVIWIPSHMQPPPSDENLLGWLVEINKVWDRMTKVLILILDVVLNGWFVHVVKQRLVKQHRLVKYKPLVMFTNQIMFISMLMDVGLVVLISLPNEMVYIQFHPCAYLVKLHIEMAMASLITRLARGQPDNDLEDDDAYGLSSQTQTQRRQRYTYNNYRNGPQYGGAKDIEMAAGAASNHSRNNSTGSQAWVEAGAGVVPKRPARVSDRAPPPSYDDSKLSLGLPHHRTMSQDRNVESCQTNNSSNNASLRASRRPSLASTIPGLGRTRFGYGDDEDEEVSLTSNAGQVGGGGMRHSRRKRRGAIYRNPLRRQVGGIRHR